MKASSNEGVNREKCGDEIVGLDFKVAVGLNTHERFLEALHGERVGCARKVVRSAGPGGKESPVGLRG